MQGWAGPPVRRGTAVPAAPARWRRTAPPSADRVHDGGAREVVEPRLRQPAAAPRPGADQRVQERAQQRGEDQEHPELHPLGEGSGNDGCGRGDEDHLEEPVGARRGVGVRRCPPPPRLPGEQRRLVVRGRVQAAQHAVPPVDVGVHQVVADRVVRRPCDRVQAEVLQADDGGVLRGHGAGFEHREAGGHPHHQDGAAEGEVGVEDEGGHTAHLIV